MTDKEKAKAYDEAIERAKKLYGNGITEEIFLELKEDDTERIKKNCIHFLELQKQHHAAAFEIEECIAWLEKQGEKKPCMVQWKGDNLKEVISFTGKDKNFEKWFKSFEEYEKYVHEHNDIFKLFNENGSHYEIPVGAWIVKTPDGYNIASNAVLKQKSADKIEPKFKVGDWVVYNNDICQIVKREEGCNKLVTVFGIEKELVNERNLSNARLWTIQDAKDGDVISFYSEYKGNKMVQIGIIEKYVGKYGGCSNTFKIYVGVNWDNNLQMGKYMGCTDIHPATKEQRDALMKAMNGAGYEWNAEKKELKKKRKS